MTQTAAGQAKVVRGAGFGTVFAVVAAGVAMSNLDNFVVNVALPEIGSNFGGASLPSLSWVLNAYAVVFAAWLIPAGRLADRTSMRRAYLFGLGLFTVASALCAVTPNVWTLIAARVAQAIGAATLIPSSLGILMVAAPPERRLSAVRAWTGLSGLAAAAGPAVGGLLTQLDWRWVFLINVPIGVAAMLVGLRALPDTPVKTTTERLDVFGAGLLTAGIALLSLGLIKTQDLGWSSVWVLGSFALSVVLLVWFVRRAVVHQSPILPLPLLRIPSVGPATFANFLFAIAFGAMLLSIVLWCQNVWSWSPLQTGLAIAPGPLMVPVLAVGVGPIAKRIGAGPIAATGCVLFAVGIAWWIVRLGAEPDYVGGVLPGMLLTGIGVGLALPSLIGAAVSVMPPQSFSTGSAVVTMTRQVGSVFGVALLVALLGTGKGHGVDTGFDHGWQLTLAMAVAAGVVSLFLPRPGRKVV
jgi:EmrB/QacA subfamily drug resistance transporter